MRLIPPLAGFLLIAVSAAAQPGPSPDQGPPPDQAQQYAPPPPAPGGQMAPPGARPTFRARFEEANTTHDGRLTLEQAQAARMGPLVRYFGEIDAGNKGYITMQDVRAWRASRRQGQNAPPPQ